MKLKNALMLPIAVACDLCTVGMAEATDRLMASDRAERRTEAELEALRLIAEIVRNQK